MESWGRGHPMLHISNFLNSVRKQGKFVIWRYFVGGRNNPKCNCMLCFCLLLFFWLPEHVAQSSIWRGAALSLMTLCLLLVAGLVTLGIICK